ELKGAGLAYSEHRFRHRIPINNSDQLVFNFEADNDYYFKVHNVHLVSDQALENRRVQEDTFDYSYDIEADAVNIQYQNHDNYPFMVLPIFDEIGWKLKVNCQDADILNVNHGLLGFEIPAGEVNIQLQFKQPFFVETVLLSVSAFGILLFMANK